MADDGQYGDPGERLAGMMVGLGAQLSAAVAETALPPRFEYAEVPWRGVNELARDGWRLVPVVIWRDGVAVFVLERQLGAADAAAEVLRQAELGLPRIAS